MKIDGAMTSEDEITSYAETKRLDFYETHGPTSTMKEFNYAKILLFS